MAREGGRRAAAPRLGPDRSGQIMILAAILLLLGFIALAGMVSRVSQLASQTTTESNRAILQEVGPLVQGMDDAIERLKETNSTDFGLNGTTTPTLEEGVIGMMAHLRQVEQSRGMFLSYDITCSDLGNPATGQVVATLSDGEVWIQVKSSVPFTRDNCSVLSFL